MNLKIIGTGSKGNAYLLENEQEALLIECGVKVSEIKKALNFNLSKVVGCIVTHEHLDHCKAVNDVLNCGIKVYASHGTSKCFPANNTHRLPLILESKSALKIGNFKILPFDIKHDAAEPMGFLIEHPDCGRVLFLTDTYYCKYTFPGLNNIIIEANYSKEIIDRNFGADSGKEFLRNRILRSHFSLENCKEMLSMNDLSAVNNIVLIHLSDGNSNEAQFQKEVQDLTGKNVSVASNGMQLKFNKTPF
jgi:phosphoribosyl 1,2-cyclic phosphodiesterase